MFNNKKDDIEKFNEEYNLNNIDDSLFTKVELNSSKTADLSGKVTTTAKEVMKRFILNPLNVIAVIVFVGIVLLSIIVTYTSMYGNPNKPISSIETSLISNLPPRSFGSFMNKNFNTTQMYALQNAGYWIVGFTKTGHKPTDPNWIIHIVRQNIDGSFYVRWNPWVFIDKNHIHHSSIDGTDPLGRDIWTMVWFGALKSLKLALFVGFIQMVIGVSIGAYIGYHAGGWIDLICMRLVNVVNLIPPIVLLIVLTFILPQSLGFWTMFIALTAIGFLVPVSYTRLYVLKIKDAQYLKASRAVGAGKGRIIFNHALPNILGKLSVLFVRRIPIIILIQTTLSFMGLSPNPGAVTLGSIINTSKDYIYMWWYILLPVGILSLITLSLQIISNGLHDAFDPKSVRVRS